MGDEIIVVALLVVSLIMVLLALKIKTDSDKKMTRIYQLIQGYIHQDTVNADHEDSIELKETYRKELSKVLENATTTHVERPDNRKARMHQTDKVKNSIQSQLDRDAFKYMNR